MRWLWLWICVGFYSADIAHAGPWPRERGTYFTALTGSYRYAHNLGQTESAGSFFGEYGLAQEFTLGLDVTDDSAGYSHALAFLKLPPRGQNLRYAPSFGLGMARSADNWHPLLRASVTAGRGLTTARPGWWTVTATLDHVPEIGDDPTLKLDATIGVELGARWKTILDMESAFQSGSDRALTLRGSIAWRWKPGKDILIGIETKDATTRSTGIRAGIWRTF